MRGSIESMRGLSPTVTSEYKCAWCADLLVAKEEGLG
jgi:hypothetical protein